MQFEILFRAASERPVRAARLGAGEFGLSLIAQARRTQGLTLTAALDRDPGRVSRALGAAGNPIAASIGIAMVSKEAECVVGPALAARARRRQGHSRLARPLPRADRQPLSPARRRGADLGDGGRTARDLPAGHVLAIEGNRHAVPRHEGELLPASPVIGSAALPYYMAVGRTLCRAVPAGAVVTVDDLIAPEDSALWTPRREADAAPR